MAQSGKTLKEAVDEARALGATDEEIWQQIQSTQAYKSAQAQGFADADLRDYFGLAPAEQNTSPARLPLMAASGAAQGFASLLGLPGDLEQWGDENLPNWLTRPIGSPEGTPPDRLFPTSAEWLGTTNSLGLTNRPELEPQDLGERLLKGTSVGLGGGLGLKTLGMGPWSELAAGAGGGLAASGVNELLPDNQLAQFMAALVGGGVVSGSMGAIERMAAKRGAESGLMDAQAAVDQLRRAHLDEANDFKLRQFDAKNAVRDVGAYVQAKGAPAIGAAFAKREAALTAARNHIGARLLAQGSLDQIDSTQSRLAGWGGLKDGEKAALVTDPAIRKALDSAWGAHADLVDEVNKTVAQAKRETATKVEELNRVAATAAARRAEEALAARQALSDAKAAVGKFRPKGESLAHTIGLASGGALAGNALLNALGIPADSLMASAAGIVGGRALPLVLGLGKQMAQSANPLLLANSTAAAGGP